MLIGDAGTRSTTRLIGPAPSASNPTPDTHDPPPAIGAQPNWQSAVGVVHHSGHLATERPRGSSALRSNVDWMFGVFRDEKEMLATLVCDKQKDDEQFGDEVFALTRHELGRDADGD